jgi:hypothetical protein
MEEKLHDMSERHRVQMILNKLQDATLTGREILGLCTATAILREEIKQDAK